MDPIEEIASRLIKIERSVAAGHRTPQLPNASVTLPDGANVGIADGLEVGTDTAADLVGVADNVDGIGEVSDGAATDQTFLPDRLDAATVPGDAALDVAVVVNARAAQAAADASAAADQAASALTTANGKNVRRRGKTEPDPPEGGWVAGDQWVVENDDGAPVGVKVWNGGAFVDEQILADELLIVGEDGTIRFKNGVITGPSLAVDALDAQTMRGAQFYGGYIEAPTIASSDRLGSGANALTDPTFTGVVNSGWIISGHTGDAAVTQRDSITWDQTWTMGKLLGGGVDTYRNAGSVRADLKLTPGTRYPGSIVMPNYAWLDQGARAFNNPYTFQSFPGWVWSPGQSGGKNDPSFRQVEAKAPGAGTARTTYLTNAAVIAIEAGQRWNMRVGYPKLDAEDEKYLSTLSVQVINSATGAIIHERALTAAERAAGSVNAWFDSTFTGLVKFRVKATYTAGGNRGRLERRPTADSYARGFTNGAKQVEWLGTERNQWLNYGNIPTEVEPGANYWTSNATQNEYRRRAEFGLVLTSAVFAQVEPSAGWRLTEAGGFELFNALGARTAHLNGADNYISGRLASAEANARWVLSGGNLEAYSAADRLILQANEDAGGGVAIRPGTAARFSFYAPIKFHEDTDWIRLDGWTNGFAHSNAPVFYRRYNGEVKFKGSLTNSTWSGALTPHGAVMPVGFRPMQAGNFSLPVNGTVSRTAAFEPGGTIRLYGSGTSGAWWVFDQVTYPFRN